MALPAATQGKPALWTAQLGTPLADLVKGLYESAGRGERLAFVDLGSGPQFVIDTPPAQPVATFYRDRETAVANGVPYRYIGGPDKAGALVMTRSADQAYNEIIVIGQNTDVSEATAAAGGPIDNADRGDLVVARWADEASWKDVDHTFYLNVRKTLIVVDPTVADNDRAAERCLELQRRFGRYQNAGRFGSFYIPQIRPGDLVVIDMGTTGDSGGGVTRVNTGTTPPDAGLGSEGDYWLNTATGDVYGPKSGAEWGDPHSGTGDGWATGTVPPDSGSGADGDRYFQTGANIVYERIDGTWTQVSTAAGPPNVFEIAGMNVRLHAMGNPLAGRYVCDYEIREVSR